MKHNKPSATNGEISPTLNTRLTSRSGAAALLAGLLILSQLLSGNFGNLYGQNTAETDSASQFDWSKHEPKWHATFNGSFKASESRRISQLGFTMPVAQNDHTLLFIDFRGRTDDLDHDEFNAGLVLRTMLASDWIFGAYGYFDRADTPNGNVFEQGTFGFELLSEHWDFRINGYIPELSGQDVGPAPGFGTATVSGNQFVVNSQRLVERAYRGIDYEAGRLLTNFGESNELRLYGGGFYFENEAPGFPHIAGPRARLEARLFDLSLLGDGSRVTFSGEVQRDEVRGTETYAGIGVQIPLGKWGKNRSGGDTPFGSGTRYGSLSRLERRMYDPVVRDIDIVTNVGLEGNTAEVLQDAEGDGLYMTSADFSIEQAVALAGPNGTVAVSGEVSTDGNVQLQSGQRLTSVTAVQSAVGSETGIRVSGPLPGSQGVITVTNPANPVILLTDNVMVDSLHINSGLNGLQATGSVNGVTIADNIIAGASGSFPNGNSILIDGDFDGFITRNTLRDNTQRGLSITGNNAGTLSFNTANGNGGDGFGIVSNSGTITGNIANGNSNGFQIFEFADGSLTGNTANNNTGNNGFIFQSITGGIISGNTANNNRNNGFGSNTVSGATITGNTANNNANTDGFNFSQFNGGTISGNTANNNGRNGFLIFNFDDGTFSGNVANNNTGGGLAGAGAFSIFNFNNGSITGNTANANATGGFAIISGFNGGTISGNSANNNTGSGYDIPFAVPAGGSASGNTGNGNGSNDTFP